MELIEIILLSFLLFIVIYYSVSLAIKPLLNKSDQVISTNNDLGLTKLRDIGILTNSELEEIIRLYKNTGTKKEAYEQYEKYVKVLKELKDMGYFSDEQYINKNNKLREHFKID